MKLKYKILIVIMIIIIFIIYDFFKNYSTILNIKPDNFINHYNNKRVAILISGQLRDNYYQVLMIQKLFVIDMYNADVFCSFSDDVNDNIKVHINNILKPKYIEWVESDNKYNLTNNITYNSYLMFKKIYLCNQYKLNYEKKNYFKYDMVIRIRPDLIVTSAIPKLDLTQNIIYLPEYKVKIMKYITNMFFKTPDNIAISNSYMMDVYSDVYIYFIEKIKTISIILPEMLLEKYFSENLIEFKLINFPFIVYKYSCNLSNNNNKANIKKHFTNFILYFKNKNLLLT